MVRSATMTTLWPGTTVEPGETVTDTTCPSRGAVSVVPSRRTVTTWPVLTMSPTVTGTRSTWPDAVARTVVAPMSCRIRGDVTVELTVPVSAHTTIPTTSTPLATRAKRVHVGASRTTRSTGSADAVSGRPRSDVPPGPCFSRVIERPGSENGGSEDHAQRGQITQTMTPEEHGMRL